MAKQFIRSHFVASTDTSDREISVDEKFGLTHNRFYFAQCVIRCTHPILRLWVSPCGCDIGETSWTIAPKRHISTCWGGGGGCYVSPHVPFAYTGRSTLKGFSTFTETHSNPINAATFTGVVQSIYLATGPDVGRGWVGTGWHCRPVPLASKYRHCRGLPLAPILRHLQTPYCLGHRLAGKEKPGYLLHHLKSFSLEMNAR